MAEILNEQNLVEKENIVLDNQEKIELKKDD